MATYDVNIYEPCRPLTVDNSTITVDATWPTADTISLPVVDLVDGIVAVLADVIEPAAAIDELDATVVAADVAILLEAADATDVVDADVVAAHVPVPGGAPYPRLRLRPVVGVGLGILPAFEGEAHGVAGIVGAGVGKLPRFGGSAEGSVGVAGRSAAQIFLPCAAAIGDCGQAGRADALLKRFVVVSRGAAVVHGSGIGTLVKLHIAGTGQHDDDDAAVMTFLLAA